MAVIRGFGYSNPGGGGASGGNAALGWSAPSGLAYRNAITFSTDGTNPFGSGPTYHFYEDFNGVSVGGAFTTGNTGFSRFGNTPTAESDDTGSGKSMRMWFGSDATTLGVAEIDMGANYTEMYVGYSVKIPTGTYFPGASAVQTFPGASVWKFFWAFLEDGNSHGGNNSTANGGNNSAPTDSNGDPTGQGTDNDCIFFNYGGQFKVLDGNDLQDLIWAEDYVDINPRTFWGWDQRNRINIWCKADPVNPATADTQVAFQLINSTNGYKSHSWNPLPTSFSNSTPRPIFSQGIGTLHAWRYINAPGYMGNFSGTNYDPRFSDIIVNAGPNAAARIEFGNNATYTSCTKLYPAKITSWSGSSIVASLTSGDISLSGTVYAFITLANNSTRYSVQVH